MRRRFGRTVDAAACRLPTIKEEAYFIQEAIVALSGLERRGYKVGASLLPFDEESIMRSILSPPILCGVGGQFVKCGSHRLSSLRF